MVKSRCHVSFGLFSPPSNPKKKYDKRQRQQIYSIQKLDWGTALVFLHSNNINIKVLIFKTQHERNRLSFVHVKSPKPQTTNYIFSSQSHSCRVLKSQKNNPAHQLSEFNGQIKIFYFISVCVQMWPWAVQTCGHTFPLCLWHLMNQVINESSYKYRQWK